MTTIPANRARHSDAEIWKACEQVITSERTPLEVHRVATAAGISEEDVIAALIRESGPRRSTVTFRFPPLPCAAITAIGGVVGRATAASTSIAS